MKGDKRFYLDVLKAEQCRCERMKKRGKAFCWSCYYRLPDDMRKALWLPLGGGFEGAYEEACRYLGD